MSLSYDCPFVHPFLITTFFSRLAHQFFLTLCMKLKNHKYSRLWESNFFGKILARHTTARNGPIFPFVLYCSVFFVIGSLVFYFIFCMKLREVENILSYVRKTDGVEFFKKNSCLCKNEPKRCKMIQYLAISPLWKHFFTHQICLIYTSLGVF